MRKNGIDSVRSAMTDEVEDRRLRVFLPEDREEMVALSRVLLVGLSKQYHLSN